MDSHTRRLPPPPLLSCSRPAEARRDQPRALRGRHRVCDCGADDSAGGSGSWGRLLVVRRVSRLGHPRRMLPFHLRAFKARPIPEAAAAFALRAALLLLPDAAAVEAR